MPLDWYATFTEDSAVLMVIDVIKLPARVPVSDLQYGGSITMNPGGSGESGVYQVPTDGLGLQTVVDSNILPEAG